MKRVFCISDEDVQSIALWKIGRKLTDDEMYSVQKGVEFGLECWEEVVIYAIRDITEEN